MFSSIQLTIIVHLLYAKSYKRAVRASDVMKVFKSLLFIEKERKRDEVPLEAKI